MKKYFAIAFLVAALLLSKPSSIFASTLYSNDFTSSVAGFTQIFGSCSPSPTGLSCVGSESGHSTALQYNSTVTNPTCISADFTNPGSIYDQLFLTDTSSFANNAINLWIGNNGFLEIVGNNSNATSSVTVPSGQHNYMLCKNGDTFNGYIDGTSVVSYTESGHNPASFGLSTTDSVAVTNLIVTDSLPGAPTPTPTPTPAPETIAVSPSTANVSVGTPFNTTITVSGGQAFNATAAHVALSSNLTLTGIHSAPSPACNLQYTLSPSTSDPSFAGAIYGSSSTNCNVYTLTLTPNATGVGTITLTNGQIKAFSDSSEILSGVTNGSFTINAATPTPTPVGQTTLTLDDSIQGTGQNQWNYTGSNWGHCTNCNETNPTVTFYNASQSYDNTTDEYATLTFTGTQVALYGVIDPRGGISGVSIDNGTETNVDFYGATRTGNVLLWTSPTLPNTTHTLKVRVIGTHDSNATDNYIILDRADVSEGPSNNTSITFNTYPLDTYASTFNLTGTKDSSLTNIFVNGSAANSTYPTTTTWQNVLTLALGANTLSVYGTDSGNNQTATQTIQINRHTLGDINGDGVVDLTDASLFAVDYGKTSNLTYPLSDMNGDGNVDLTDLSILAKLESQ